MPDRDEMQRRLNVLEEAFAGLGFHPFNLSPSKQMEGVQGFRLDVGVEVTVDTSRETDEQIAALEMVYGDERIAIHALVPEGPRPRGA